MILSNLAKFFEHAALWIAIAMLLTASMAFVVYLIASVVISVVAHAFVVTIVGNK